MGGKTKGHNGTDMSGVCLDLSSSHCCKMLIIQFYTLKLKLVFVQVLRSGCYSNTHSIEVQNYVFN